MTDRELMQMALDALESVFEGDDKGAEYWTVNGGTYEAVECMNAMRALRAALAQPEPVAWIDTSGHPKHLKHLQSASERKLYGELQPLYTAPPQRDFVGLTDEEMMVAAYKAGFDIHEDYDNEDDPDLMHWWSPDNEVCDDCLLNLRDIIESKLKEKNK